MEAGAGRFKGPQWEEMDEEQRRIYNEIVSSRTTGIRGPFGPWLARPSIADPAQKLGRACRYGTQFAPKESEMIIMMTASYTRCATEWRIHLEEARAHQVSESFLAVLEGARTSSWVRDVAQDSTIQRLLDEELEERTRMLIRVAGSCLETSGKLDNQLYQEAVATFQDPAVIVDIVCIVGYYTMVAMTLNAFEIV